MGVFHRWQSWESGAHGHAYLSLTTVKLKLIDLISMYATVSVRQTVFQEIRYVHPNVPLVSDGAVQGWDGNVLVLSWLASGREVV
jgi:hypothetical protein